MLSFVGAKGCIFGGGNVDMGSSDGTAGTAGDGMGVAGSMTGGSAGTGMGVAGGMTGGYAGTGMGVAGDGMGVAGSGATGGTGMGVAGMAGTGAAPGDEERLNIDATGMLLGPRGVAGPFYAFSDGLGADNSTATGDCELAGHEPAECAEVFSPTPGSGFTNMGGVMCTSGQVETIVDIPGQTGCPMTSASCDWAHQWGAGIGFNLEQMGETRGIFNASAANVIGIAFDIDQIPGNGLRVMFPMPNTTDAPHVWLPGSASANYASPVVVGHNRILFATDVAQPDYVPNPVPFDPTQLAAVQFLIPTRTTATVGYQFCVSNVSLIVGDPGGGGGGGECPGGAAKETGFAYRPEAMCLSPVADQLSCPPPAGTMIQTIPSMPALANYPCAKRISDGALYVAIDHAMTPIGAGSVPQSDWARLSPGEWVDCTAAEAELVSSVSTCPIIPL